MLSWDVEPQPPHINGPCFLWKLLIDSRYQRRGYGQEVVREVMELVRGQGATELLTSHVPGEGGPAGFHARLGFVPRGDVDPDGEIILRLDLHDCRLFSRSSRARMKARRGPSALVRSFRRTQPWAMRTGSEAAIRDSLRVHRSAARTAGILYIIGTVAGVLSVVVLAPVRGAGDPLAAGARHSGAVVTGALLVLAMGLSLALVPVVLFPVLRRVDEVLAIGYLVVRGAVETACYLLSAISLLLLLPLGEVMSAGPGTASPAGIRLGGLLLDQNDVGAVLALVFCFGGVLFYLLLYRSRIVPRWIALWGLGAIPFYVAAYLLAMYAVIGANSTALNVLVLPLAVQEMVLAVWMIAKGFTLEPNLPATENRA